MTEHLAQMFFVGVAALAVAIPLMALFYEVSRLHDKVDRVVAGLARISHKEAVVMDNLQDILSAVQAQTTLVESVVAFIDGLESSAVDPAAKQAIIDALTANSAALEAAIAANVPPTP